MTILEMLELLKEIENVEILYNDEHNCTEFQIYYRNNIVVSALEKEKDQIYVCYYLPRLTDVPSYYSISFNNELIFRNKQNIEVINLNVIDIEKWCNEIKNSIQMYDKEKTRCLELLEK